MRKKTKSKRPSMFLRFLTRICSKRKPDEFYINTSYYSTHPTASTASRVFAQGFKFLCNRGSNYDQREHFFIHNSKPEVEIDFVPTAFITDQQGLKYPLTSFCQVAPQVP